MITLLSLYAFAACFALLTDAQNVDWTYPPAAGPALTFPASSSIEVQWSAPTFGSPSLILWCPDFSTPPNYYKHYDSQVPQVGHAVVSLNFIGNGDFLCHFELVPAGAEHGENSNAFYIGGPDKVNQLRTTYGASAATVTEEITQAPVTVTEAGSSATTKRPETVTVQPADSSPASSARASATANGAVGWRGCGGGGASGMEVALGAIIAIIIV